MTRRTTIIAAVLVSVGLAAAAPRRAEAGCGGPCPTWVRVMAYGLAAGLVGGYAGVTGYFAYHDLTDDTQTLKYAGTELVANTALGALFVAGTYASIRDRSVAGTITFGSLAAVHTTLAVHGALGVADHRNELFVDESVLWKFAALVYLGNTAVWALQVPGPNRDRDLGIAEAVINAPIALGLGYVAIDRANNDEPAQAAGFAAMAAVSGALAFHGILVALDPDETPGIDLLGTDVVPTVVEDGQDRAFGLGVAGVW